MTPQEKREIAQRKAHVSEWKDSRIVHEIQKDKARHGGKLHKLSADAFLRREQENAYVIRERKVEDEPAGHGFAKGDRVRPSHEGMMAQALGVLPSNGVVTGVMGPFIRVGTELYAPKLWERVEELAHFPA